MAGTSNLTQQLSEAQLDDERNDEAAVSPPAHEQRGGLDPAARSTALDNSVRERSLNESRQAKKRIRKELVAIEREPVDGITLGLVGDDLLEMQATITGPADSPYEGGIFNIHIYIPDTYPLNPPKFTFVTRIFHPNIDASGNISCNLLGSHWCPALTIEKLLLCIQSQLDDPFGDDRNNPDVECLVPQVAEVFWESREVYEQCVRRWVEKYAMAS